MIGRLIISLAFLPMLLVGQSYQDALRYSVFHPYGSARFNSLGGAMTALGGDISAGLLNPASGAVFNQDEISIGFGYVNNTSESELLTAGSEKSNFLLTHMGGVFKIDDHKNGMNERNWSFSLALNKVADFNERSRADLYYDESSLIDWFLEGAEGTPYQMLDPFSDQLAWNAYLIDTSGGSSSYVGALSKPGQQIQEDIRRWGGITDLGLQVAKRHSHKLMFGFGLHLPIIRFREEASYSESDFDDSDTYLKSYSYETDLKADGIGINLKAGLIFRPINWFRLGVTVHSPTWYSITERYSSSIRAVYENGSDYETFSPQGEFMYELRTPARMIVGTAFVIHQYAFISVEYEWMDYDFAKLNSVEYSYSRENQDIQTNLNAAGILRAGFEFRVDHLSLRLGYGSMGNPWDNMDSFDQQNWSVGLAFRAARTFFDLSFSSNRTTTTNSLYELASADSPTADVTNTKNYLIFSVGQKF